MYLVELPLKLQSLNFKANNFILAFNKNALTKVKATKNHLFKIIETSKINLVNSEHYFIFINPNHGKI